MTSHQDERLQDKPIPAPRLLAKGYIPGSRAPSQPKAPDSAPPILPKGGSFIVPPATSQGHDVKR
jgi:hypothetical protein